MKWISKLRNLLFDQNGQGMVEYNLVLILLSLVAIAALMIIGNFVPGAFSGASGALH
jgi:pilus assembly protein Flp/PilA